MELEDFTADDFSAKVKDNGSSLSKNQLKKVRKRERKLEAIRLRKLREKEAKREKAEAQGRDLVAEERFRLQRTAAGDSKRRRQESWDTHKLPLAQMSFQICLDCSFEERMTEKEIASLAKQLRYCYAYNKRSPHPCLWAATSLAGETLQLLQKETGFTEWPNRAFLGTNRALEDYYQDKLQSVVYLTSDSETTIKELDNSKVYVIGGIVDRNRCKGAAFERAGQLGVTTAKLPLDEHIQTSATPILTCNHVFAILLKYREHGNDWGAALRYVLPTRKEATYKETGKKPDGKEDERVQRREGKPQRD